MMRIKMTSRIAGALFLLASAPFAMAAGGYEGLESSGINVHDLASVQRGAGLFFNYCHSCHSAEYMRYQRLSQDWSCRKKWSKIIWCSAIARSPTT